MKNVRPFGDTCPRHATDGIKIGERRFCSISFGKFFVQRSFSVWIFLDVSLIERIRACIDVYRNGEASVRGLSREENGRNSLRLSLLSLRRKMYIKLDENRMH